MNVRRYSWLTVLLLGVPPAWAQFENGSDGSDGTLDCDALIAAYGCPVGCDPCAVEIDLGLAATDICGPGGSEPCMWDSPSPVAGQGVYDPDKWAIVFKYTTIDIPATVTITFKNHPSGAPVVWLASGDISIEGAVTLDGEDGSASILPWFFAEPGPGGFAGGRDWSDVLRTAGFGPGGGTPVDCDGGHGSPASYSTAGHSPCNDPPGSGSTYGNVWIFPLIGGSGGAGSAFGGQTGGGAGAGAMLMASSGGINLEGSINATGGNGGQGSGGGSGGGIRLVANTISGPGQLRATGGGGDLWYHRAGDGRIRVEGYSIDLSDAGVPPWISSTPFPVFWDSGIPILRVAAIDETPAPSDPLAGPASVDVTVLTSAPVTINIEATNIPEGTTVQARIVSLDTNGEGEAVEVTSTPLEDSGGGLLIATAEANLPYGRSEIQLRAKWGP